MNKKGVVFYSAFFILYNPPPKIVKSRNGNSFCCESKQARGFQHIIILSILELIFKILL
jgi:hypothetical protein